MTQVWQSIKRSFAEARRRRVLRALGLYVVAGWLLLQVADVTFEPLGIPLWAHRALIVALVAGLVPAAILAWIFDLTRGGIARTPDLPGPEDAARRALAAPGSASSNDAAAAPAAPMSPIAAIAILPFSDLSPGGDHGWFCDGLAEEIVDALCCVQGLRVASRTASARFRDGGTDPREIGRLLGVDAILEGSVRVADGRLRIGAQLVDAREGFHTWSDAYERPMADVFAVQRGIAESVARALKLSIAAPVAGRADKYAPRTLEAYEAYLRGRQALGEFRQRQVLVAAEQFRRAIALDPMYPQAHAGLADALAQAAQWRFLPPAETIAEGTTAASRALDLAPDLAEAHMAQGHLRSLGGDQDGARRAFERALELNPALYDAWNYYARHCYAHGEHARAAELFQRAYRLRPDDYSPLVFASGSLAATGDADGSLALARRAADGLLRQCALEPQNLRAHYLAPGVLQQVGRLDDAHRLAERALALGPDDWSALYNVACFHSAIGETDRALELLEKVVRAGGGYREWLENDPDLDPLRALPRFQALLAELHVPE